MPKRKKGEVIPQKYRHLKSGEVVKVERVNSLTVVVHFAAGSEREKEGILRTEFEYLGEWDEQRQAS